MAGQARCSPERNVATLLVVEGDSDLRAMLSERLFVVRVYHQRFPGTPGSAAPRPGRRNHIDTAVGYRAALQGDDDEQL
jgi:hypothetical protein